MGVRWKTYALIGGVAYVTGVVSAPIIGAIATGMWLGKRNSKSTHKSNEGSNSHHKSNEGSNAHDKSNNPEGSDKDNDVEKSEVTSQNP